MNKQPIDAKQVEETYRQFFPVIQRKCNRMVHNSADAQDLAQETFMRFWEKRTSLKDTDAQLTWIYRTATHLVIDRIRRGTRSSPVVLKGLLESIDDTNPLRVAESRNQLERIIRYLSTKELEAIILARIDGLTHNEIGNVMKLSDRSVRRLLHKADNRLRQILGRSSQ